MIATETQNRMRIQAEGLSQKALDLVSPELMTFITSLHERFKDRREEILERRKEDQQSLDNGVLPTYPEECIDIRNGEWQVNPIPADLQERKVEITGPVDRKMMINALNSGASVFMADLEDANSPTLANVFEGQVNLYDAVRKNIHFLSDKGKEYALNEETATLVVRPRGWHLTEKHVEIDGEIISASLLDFGIYFFLNAKYLIENSSGPYFYLPKLEHYTEARLWNDVFKFSQDYLGIKQGSIKVTVLIETISGALQLEEIIYELKEHLAGLNAGRWDYIFSVIKKFRNQPGFCLPDRSEVTMKSPFMLAYTKRLAEVCHKRGAHAIGGMSAFIPTKDEEINKKVFDKVAGDKQHEADLGFDGSWVAHPGLVSTVREVFDKAIPDEANQKAFKPEYNIKSADLIDFVIPGSGISEGGIRTNIRVGILYLRAWLNGVGAAAIDNLMEDAATAEISRAQLWLWLRQKEALLINGNVFNQDLYQKIKEEELSKIKEEIGEDKSLLKAVELFDALILEDEFQDFLTIKAYQELK